MRLFVELLYLKHLSSIHMQYLASFERIIKTFSFHESCHKVRVYVFLFKYQVHTEEYVSFFYVYKVILNIQAIFSSHHIFIRTLAKWSTTYMLIFTMVECFFVCHMTPKLSIFQKGTSLINRKLVFFFHFDIMQAAARFI